MRLLVSCALLCLALTGCADDLLTSGDQQGFVTSSGEIRIASVEDRRAPDSISGESLDGDELSLGDLEGKVVVMPVWGSWCGPCRKEGPMLSSAATDLADDGVVFLGINTRDESVEKAQAFVRRFDISYPSIYNPSGSLLLGFNGDLSPNVIPSVAFIDSEGRLAAVVRGEITRTTLYDVIEDIRA